MKRLSYVDIPARKIVHFYDKKIYWVWKVWRGVSILEYIMTFLVQLYVYMWILWAIATYRTMTYRNVHQIKHIGNKYWTKKGPKWRPKTPMNERIMIWKHMLQWINKYTANENVKSESDTLFEYKVQSTRTKNQKLYSIQIQYKLQLTMEILLVYLLTLKNFREKDKLLG